MATDLQKELAEAIVKNTKRPRNKRKNKGELLESIGYAATTAKHIPKQIIESKGVKEALKGYGLTEELITTALVFDIENKPKARVKELNLGAEILGMKKEQENVNQTNVFFMPIEIMNKHGITPSTEGNSEGQS